jgi:hypothetical protein
VPTQAALAIRSGRFPAAAGGTGAAPLLAQTSQALLTSAALGSTGSGNGTAPPGGADSAYYEGDPAHMCFAHIEEYVDVAASKVRPIQAPIKVPI